MKAELKGYYCITREVGEPFDLDGWLPDDPEDFDLTIDFYIGAEGSEALDAFTIRACSPKRFFREAGKAISVATHVLFMEHFDGPAIKNYIEEECAKLEGEVWEQLALRLHDIGCWELIRHAVLTPRIPTPYQELQKQRLTGKPPTS